ncbi:MAG TPA: dinitrogenase iron-molybdenum cofactor biosynthesis protein [Thermoplasmata archaeon]|nr:dinitrogenase iron-molybdenum cofactor biosynthesis protein [Thermoplasmata archaeon]
MKICVTSTGKNLDAQVDSRFGRCRYFLVVDTETMDAEAISNEGAAASGGAGIKAAQTIAGADVKTVLTGNVGPNAFQILQAAGIKVVTGVNGRVKDVVEKYKKGELRETTTPSVRRHFGMGGKQRM